MVAVVALVSSFTTISVLPSVTLPDVNCAFAAKMVRNAVKVKIFLIFYFFKRFIIAWFLLSIAYSKTVFS